MSTKNTGEPQNVTEVSPRVPRTVYLASGTLPAAGAYTSTAAFTLPEDVRRVRFYISYKANASGGYPNFKLYYGNGVELPLASLQGLPGAPPGTDTATTYQYTLDFEVVAGETTIALQAAEVGVTATPGTCAIALTAG